MMLYPSLSKLLEKVSSRYMLVNVLAYRAREIAAAADESGEPLNEKAVSLAIEELASGELKTRSEQ